MIARLSGRRAAHSLCSPDEFQYFRIGIHIGLPVSLIFVIGLERHAIIFRHRGMTVKLRRLYAAHVSLACLLARPHFLIRAREHPESRAFIIRALEIIVERSDSLSVLLCLQIL